MFNINFSATGQGYLNIVYKDTEDEVEKTDSVKVYYHSTICGKISLLALKFLGLFSENYKPIQIKLAKDKEFKRIGMLPLEGVYITKGSYKQILKDDLTYQLAQNNTPADLQQINEIAAQILETSMKKPRINLKKGCSLAKKMQANLLFKRDKLNVFSIIEELNNKFDPSQKSLKLKFHCLPSGKIVLNSNLKNQSEEIELEFLLENPEKGSACQVCFPETFPSFLISTFKLLHNILKSDEAVKNELFSERAQALKQAVWKKEFDFTLSSNQYSFDPDMCVKVNGDGEEYPVNANEITLGKNQFIAMAYPQHAELFWNMMYQKESSIWVKLADDDQYWPEVGDDQMIGGLGVSCLSVIEDKDGNTTREFEIQKFDDDNKPQGAPKKVTQFEYASWPDFGLPYPDYEDFIKNVAKCHNKTYAGKGPITVHCVAGQGRTGTFIASYQMIQNPKEDPYTLVDEMRKQRPGKMMIETRDQYVLLNNLKEKYLLQNH